MTVRRSRSISPYPSAHTAVVEYRVAMRQTKDSYLPNGRFTQQDKLDAAAGLGWRSGRVCHNRRRYMQVHEWEGVVASFLSTRKRSARG